MGTLLSDYISLDVNTIRMILATLIAGFVLLKLLYKRRTTPQAVNNIVNHQMEQKRQPKKQLTLKEKFLANMGRRQTVVLSLDILKDNISIIKELCIYCDVIIVGICNEADEEDIKTSVMNELSNYNFKIHRLLLCSGITGKTAIYRQIKPDLLCCTDYELIKGLKKYLPWVVYIGDNNQNNNENIQCSNNVFSLFEM